MKRPTSLEHDWAPAFAGVTRAPAPFSLTTLAFFIGIVVVSAVVPLATMGRRRLVAAVDRDGQPGDVLPSSR